MRLRRKSVKLTSGPFIVPSSVDGTRRGAVRVLQIGLKNISNRRSTVIISVHVCRERALFPATPPEIRIFRRRVTIPAGNCAFLRVPSGPNTFRGNNMLRVVMEGDTSKNANGVVIALSGTTANGRTATPMIFKHEEFIKVK